MKKLQVPLSAVKPSSEHCECVLLQVAPWNVEVFFTCTVSTYYMLGLIFLKLVISSRGTAMQQQRICENYFHKTLNSINP